MNKKSKPDEVKDKSAKNSKAEKTTDKPEEKATEKKKEPTLEERLNLRITEHGLQKKKNKPMYPQKAL